ncbi:MAG: class I SAM-dependent methyltransferase [Ilumatobacteraceae bacterium]
MTAPSDTVAVVGCGSSTLIGELLDDGYTAITAIDIAQSAIDQLGAGLGDRAERVTMVRADVRTVELANSVTLWHDRATFHFLTDIADQTAYAITAARSVRLGGHLVLAEFAADGPTSCSGLTVARHSAASLQSVFSDGFELIESFERDHVTPSGAVQRFIHALMVRRCPPSVPASVVE